MGLTVSGTIHNNVLQSRLRTVVRESVAEQLASSTHSLESLGLNAGQKAAVLDAYMQGIRIIFILYRH